jgi:hypothetical protein
MRVGMMIGLATLVLTVVGCKEEEDPEDIPMDTPTVEADDDDSPPQSSASQAETDAGSDAATVPSPATAPAKVTRRTGASIDACCAALRSASAKKQSNSGKTKRLKQAAGLCASIAPMVKSGKTTRTTALRQVRAFAGGASPAACN